MAVRNEAVRLSLQDAGFSTGMAKAAAATALLDKQLDALDGTNVRTGRSLASAAVETDRVGTSASATGSEIDKLSGRMRIMADLAAILGPSLVPIGAVALPAMAGLAAQAGFAAFGIGSLVVASQGLGDALKAVNEAALDPSVKNLEKAQEAMSRLAPEAQTFVREFQAIRPVLTDIRDAAAAGWFPGLTESLDHLVTIAPQVASLFEAIGATGGNLIAEGAEALTGAEWGEFLSFVEDNAPAALDDLARTVGNVVSGLADLWMAFDPLNDDFSSWLLDASRSFAEWADGLSQTQGFRDFVDYIRENGPRVEAALVAVGDAAVQIVQAVAPLGGPSLQIIESVAKALGAIADSDFGTPILAGAAALALLNRTLQVTAALQTRLGLSSSAAASGAAGGGLLGMLGLGQGGSLRRAGADLRTYAALRTQIVARTEAETRRMNASLAAARTQLGGIARNAGPAALALGTFAVAASDTEQSLVGTNTAMGAMLGMMAGPWGAAVGAAIGNFLDMKAAIEAANEAAAAGDQAMASALLQQRQDRLSMTDPMNWLTGEGVRASVEDIVSWVTTGQTASQKLAEAAGSWEKGRNIIDVAREAGVEVEDFAGRTDELTAAIERNQLRMAREKEVLRETRAAAMEAAAGFVDLSTSMKPKDFNLSDWLKQLEDGNEAMRNFRRNAVQAASRGLDDGLIRSLREMGPEGALQLRHLANASEKEIRRANAAWRSNQREIRLSGQTIEDMARKAVGAFRSLPKDVRTEIRTEGIPRTEAEVDRLVEKYNLTEKERRALITLTDNASGRIQGVIGLLNQVRDKSVTITTYTRQVDLGRQGIGPRRIDDGSPAADGTTVPDDGGPYSDRFPYLLAPREEVVSDRFGGATKNRAELKAASRGAKLAVVRGAADGATVPGGKPIRVRGPFAGRASAQVVRHVFEIRVGGEVDFERGKAQLRQVVRDEIDQHDSFYGMQE